MRSGTMKRLGRKKVESKHDIRFYCVVCGENLSIRDTLTHDYLAYLTLDDTGKALQVVKSLLELGDKEYYTLVLKTGVSKEYLQECAQRYKDGLKDTKHTESIEWVDKAWFDQTVRLIEGNNLGEISPIGANGALEAILAYKEPEKRLKRPMTATNTSPIEEITLEEETTEEVQDTTPEETKDHTLKTKATPEARPAGKKKLIRRLKR